MEWNPASHFLSTERPTHRTDRGVSTPPIETQTDRQTGGGTHTYKHRQINTHIYGQTGVQTSKREREKEGPRKGTDRQTEAQVEAQTSKRERERENSE